MGGTFRPYQSFSNSKTRNIRLNTNHGSSYGISEAALATAFPLFDIGSLVGLGEMVRVMNALFWIVDNASRGNSSHSDFLYVNTDQHFTTAPEYVGTPRV